MVTKLKKVTHSGFTLQCNEVAYGFIQKVLKGTAQIVAIDPGQTNGIVLFTKKHLILNQESYKDILKTNFPKVSTLLIIEDYLVRRVTKDIMPKEFIGMWIAHLYHLTGSIAVLKQTPSQAKVIKQVPKIDEGIHARDAFRHLLYWCLSAK